MKSVGFFVLWLIGSAVAVSVAFAGIAVVDDELVNPPPAQVANLANQGGNVQGSVEPDPDDIPVSGTPARSPGTTAPATVATPARTLPTAVPATPTSSPASISPAAAPPTATPAAVPPTSVPPTAVPPTAAPTAVPPTPVPLTTAPTAVPPTRVPPTRVPPTSVPATAAPTASPVPEPQAQVVTFNLVGGSTAISFSASRVEVLWASPNPGFEVDINAGSNLRVEFESEDHRSRLDATWSAGPQHEIREDAR